MKIVEWDKLDQQERRAILARPLFKNDESLSDKVKQIVEGVKERGDTALREYAFKFDESVLNDLRVPPEKLKKALTDLSPDLRSALERAKANIEAFHQAERPEPLKVETMPGVLCELQWRALETVGLYIPGGTAPLFSTVLMLALPARLAGCRRVILCTPAKKDEVHPVVLAAAWLCGIEEVFAVGGAQAIAAMAYGTRTIPKVDKIFGPGNAFVTCAKQQVSQDPRGAAIDMPAGPSEVMVIAEKSASAKWVAADLLAQAEHDTLAQAILVTTDLAWGREVEKEMAHQLVRLPRKSIAEKSLEEGRIICAENMKVAIEIANTYAPEHLILHNTDAAQWVSSVRHAGSVFVGALTPEAAGDYATGTNHVLPTYGYAQAYNGVNLLSFMKSMTVQTISEQGLKSLGPTIIHLAEAEGLEAHAAAVRVRLEDIA